MKISVLTVLVIVVLLGGVCYSADDSFIPYYCECGEPVTMWWVRYNDEAFITIWACWSTHSDPQFAGSCRYPCGGKRSKRGSSYHCRRAMRF